MLKPDYINLENGYYCFLPQETLEKYIEHIREINYQGSFYMRGVQFQKKHSKKCCQTRRICWCFTGRDCTYAKYNRIPGPDYFGLSLEIRG